MLKRIIFLISVIAVVSPICIAQEQVKDEFVFKMKQSYNSMTTLQSDFEQTKTMSIMKEDLISSGSFYYQKPDMMKWDQTSPELYYFIINKKEIIRFNGKKRQTLSPSSPQAMVFREFILGTVDGSIFEDDRFESIFSQKEKHIEVVLTPKQGNMKKRIDKITLVFNSESMFLKTLSIEEKGGDLTTIEFANQQLNNELTKSTFE